MVVDSRTPGPGIAEEKPEATLTEFCQAEHGTTHLYLV